MEKRTTKKIEIDQRHAHAGDVSGAGVGRKGDKTGKRFAASAESERASEKRCFVAEEDR